MEEWNTVRQPIPSVFHLSLQWEEKINFRNVNIFQSICKRKPYRKLVSCWLGIWEKMDPSTSCFLPLLHCWIECHLVISALLLLLGWVSPPLPRGQLYKTVQITWPHGTDSTFSRVGAVLPERFAGFLYTCSHCILPFLWDKVIFYTRAVSLPLFQNIRPLSGTKYMLLILFTVYFRKKKNKAMVWELNYIFFHTTHDLN